MPENEAEQPRSSLMEEINALVERELRKGNHLELAGRLDQYADAEQLTDVERAAVIRMAANVRYGMQDEVWS
jgi:hypothetical protein